MTRKLAQDLLAHGRILEEEGLTFNAGGNLSLRLPGQGAFLITPSGMDYQSLREEDLVTLSLEGEVLEGDRKPSSEWQLHQKIYQDRPDIQALIHSHSPYIGVVSILGDPMPPVSYLLATAGVGEIPLAPYETYGTQALAHLAVQALGKVSRAVILANHGLVAGGQDLKGALELTRNLEFNAQLYIRGLATGKSLSYIPQDKIQEMIDKSKTYGQ
ncbi:MAG: class II aldolase/adducin family protein [Tissierellia bacterium]|nr:class II aldolase/adducin family protein [Tissierellia bacterium]